MEWDPKPINDDPSALLAGNGKKITKVEVAISFLCGALGRGPVRETEVRKMADKLWIKLRTLERAKDALKVISRKVGMGGGEGPLGGGSANVIT